MLNSVIRFALRQPVLIAAVAMFALVMGGREAILIIQGDENAQLPIDVFPDLNRPRALR